MGLPPEIVVTGTGLPDTPAVPAYDTQLLDRQRLTTSASGRIEDALASVAGFQQFRRSDSRSANPSAQGVTLRALGGNATSRALVLLDGVPMADPFFGYIPFSAIAPERLDSARVTRGGGSGPFGAGALAGTIELTSAGPGTLAPVTGSALINDRMATELSAAIAPHLGSGFAVVSARWDRGQGFFTTPPDQRVPASARASYDSWSAQVRGVITLSPDIEVQARGLVFDDRRTLRFQGADSTSRGKDASLRIVGQGRWRFDALAYLQGRNFSNVVISASRFVPVLDQRNTPSTGIGGKLELRPPVGSSHVLRIGADARSASGRLAESALNPATGAVTARRSAGGHNADLGLFVEDDWSAGGFVVTAGVRLDRTTIRSGFFQERDGYGAITSDVVYPDRSHWTASFRAGARVSLTETIRLRAAAYNGLRLPTLNELYRPFVVFPVTTLANAALRNERLLGYETGLEFAPSDRLELSLTAFDNRVDDAIANVTIGPNLRQRQNIDAIHARGVEAGAAVTVGALRFDGSLVFTDARAKGSGSAAALDGRQLAQTPRWAGSATFSYRKAGHLLSLTLRHIGAQFEDDLETDRLPPATTLGAFAQWPLAGRVALELRGENITNTRIVTRNQDGSVDVGTPRTIWVGLKFEG